MFSEKDKLVYSDPATGQFFDPLAVKRRLLLAGKGRINEAFAAYADPEKRLVAEGVIVACGREAFGFAPIDPKTGNGVTDTKVIEAVTAFTRWLRGKGSPAQSGPNSAPCTDCPQTGP
jgi:hypothetical protein